jgi:hypothetical protein
VRRIAHSVGAHTFGWVPTRPYAVFSRVTAKFSAAKGRDDRAPVDYKPQ